MERLTKRCADTDGKYLPYTIDNYSGVYPDSTIGKLVERLAYYENLAEQGKVLFDDEVVDKDFPCIDCGVDYNLTPTVGSKSCKDDCTALKEHARCLNRC